MARADTAVAVDSGPSLTGNPKTGIFEFWPSPHGSGGRVFALLYATVIRNIARGYVNPRYRI